MSDRAASVLFDEIKTARRVAMRRKGLSDAGEIAESVYVDIAHLRGADNTKRVWLFYINQMTRIAALNANAKSKTDDDYQLHFHYWDDLDTPLRVERYGVDKDERRKFLRVELVELGDFGLTEIDARSDQIKDNQNRIALAKDIWDRAVRVIKPLLESHPEWLWRDAVEYLRGRDELPDLPRSP